MTQAELQLLALIAASDEVRQKILDAFQADKEIACA
jgi:hypothetical protein